MPPIRIIGPGDIRPGSDFLSVDATSHSTEPWTKMLSPFHLGPCKLYGDASARRVVNGWQYLKAYKQHLDGDNNPTDAYWQWARKGWASTWPTRYPMGKGARPEYLLWDGRRLGHVESRLQVFWPLYRDTVRETGAFRQLQEAYELGRPLALFDFEGYDHDARGLSLSAVLLDANHPMGHAFVLKAMLVHGASVTPDQILSSDLPVSVAAD